MPCYHPLPAWRGRHGGLAWHLKDARSATERLSIPCGYCFGCLQEKRRQWTVRCMMEADTTEVSSFVTLTYDDTHDPGSLQYRDLVNFFKRCRKFFAFRYFACGEYGRINYRPHYHALMFGYRPMDLEVLSQKGKTVLYRSGQIERLWKFGFSTVGDVAYESCAYVAGYVLKKLQRPAGVELVNPNTGEYLSPEFRVMSRRPGLGASWLEANKSETLRDDTIYIGGHTMMPPRFFDSRLNEAEILEQRSRRARKRDEDVALAKSANAYVSEAVAQSKFSAADCRPLEM